MKKYLPFFALPIMIVLLSRGNPFFGDTTYHSIIAQWFYDKGFGNFIIPQDMDAGHAPVFSYYLSIVWQIFGKNLFAAHLAILPFAVGIYWQLFRFISTFIEERHRDLCLILIAFEPTLLAQCTQVSYELVLVFFYLLALNSILQKKIWLLIPALIGLSIISTRGAICVSALFITSLVLNYGRLKISEEKTKSTLLQFTVFVLAGIVCTAWYTYHHAKTGWWFMTPSEAFSAQRKVLGIGGMLRNIGIIGWRCADFGRIGLWIVMLIALPVLIKKKIIQEKKFLQMFAIAFIPPVILSIAFIPFSNPIGHRYYLVFYLLSIPLVFYSIQSVFEGTKKTLAIGFSLVMLLAGHLWIYPPKIAIGWDSTLAHLPWFGLRKAMIEYVREHQIPYKSIGTNFPNKYALHETDLTDDYSRFADLDMTKNNYVIQSNIMNDFSDAELDELQNKWRLVKEYKKARIYVRLYKKQ